MVSGTAAIKSLDLSPVEMAARFCAAGESVFFDTALWDHRGPGVSIVAAAPSEVLCGHSAHDWDRLRDAVDRRKSRADLPFPDGFAAGWVDYDGRFTFGLFEDLLVFDHASECWHVVGDPAVPAGMAAVHAGGRPEFIASMTEEEFCRRVRRAQEYIAAGDIYQVNLAHRFQARWQGNPFRFYEALRHYSPAPMAGFLEMGGRSVLSASPESFLQMSGRRIQTRPIKGTRPRRPDPLADEKSAYDLLTSPKEIAELVMITDLERNDLGQVCEFGSVRVSELLKLERYEQVFHLVSTVEGELREGVDHVAALRACFPGGSITGAPKKRAMEIIAELEPEPRGLYTGAIGYFGFNGESQFNIAIRTVVVEEGLASFHAGAGIVADSIPEMEYEETLAKAAGILLAAERLGADMGEG